MRKGEIIINIIRIVKQWYNDEYMSSYDAMCKIHELLDGNYDINWESNDENG